MISEDEMLRREEATARVLDLRESAFSDLSTERVSLDGVGGRTLAGSVVAEADSPAFDSATMDGYAFDATDAYPLRIVDEVFPESEPSTIAPGEAVRIATGGPLPEGANAVLRREEATVEGDELTGTEIEPGTYTYRQASNVSAGETLFESGERLSPKDAILLCDLGVESVTVRRRLSVGVLATGTEIHEGSQSDLDSPMLRGLVRSWGHEATDEGAVPDEYERVESHIEKLAAEHDVVVTTGGTSVGRKDYVVRALGALGRVLFHGVRLRPGKPIAVAELPDHDAVAFAIPGKPIGAHTVTALVARPFFTGATHLAGVEATLARDVGIGTSGFEYAVPVSLDGDEAFPVAHTDSPLGVYESAFDASVVSSSTRASRADGFVLLTESASAGETVSVIPYPVVE